MITFFKEIFTPSNKTGPADEAYNRGAEAVWHGVFGAAFMQILVFISLYTIPLSFAMLLVITFTLYTIKEIIDYKNGGRKNDCFEDVFAVMFGAAIYNITAFPILILALGVIVTNLHIYFDRRKP